MEILDTLDNLMKIKLRLKLSDPDSIFNKLFQRIILT